MNNTQDKVAQIIANSRAEQINATRAKVGMNPIEFNDQHIFDSDIETARKILEALSE